MRRPTDVGKALARGALVRTLRHAGLHHVLHGQPCAVGLAVAHDEDREVFAEVGKALLRDLTRHPFEYEFDLLDPDFDVITIEGGGINRSGKTASLVRDRLVSRSRLFAFAPTPDDFPPLFRAAADAIIVPDPVSRHALKGAVQAVLGHAPPDDLLDAADGVPLATLGTIIRPGRNLHRAIRMLRAIQAGEPAERTRGQDGPTLDELHGLGEAAERGRSLARDLADYRAGRIPWSDVDRGILVSGPPGTGKTIFARALASTCLVPIHVHSLARWQARGYLNDLLKAMRGAFDAAKRDAPCILFLDELDAFGDRERLEGKNEQYTREVINALLECLDGADGREGVVVVGATNMPWKIDAALLRPGRLDRHIVIALPDLKARKGILRHHLRDALPGTDLTEAAERLEGASGAVIEQVVRDARRRARTDRREFTPRRPAGGAAQARSAVRRGLPAGLRARGGACGRRLPARGGSWADPRGGPRVPRGLAGVGRRAHRLQALHRHRAHAVRLPRRGHGASGGAGCRGDRARNPGRRERRVRRERPPAGHGTGDCPRGIARSGRWTRVPVAERRRRVAAAAAR
ncbi:hypothetical protein DC522_13010 [Microvirga sp. KLBC 81]|nr:hypothetical protein DC522_13010 [Microvirga sp. KLBC 81]